MPFYTFIMEFKGGTYISQVNSDSAKNACINWAENLEISKIHRFGKSSKEILIAEIKQEDSVSVNGVKNVWCVSVLIRGELVLITFIQTELINNEQLTTNN